MSIDYPITVKYVVTEDDSYYYAFLPDFGHSACSAVGDTIQEACETLELVLKDVIAVYKEDGHEIPIPTEFEFLV